MRDNVLEPVVFDSGKPGKKLLVSGLVHGNEPCGRIAIQGVIDDIRSRRYQIENGSVIFLPVSNPLAFAKNVRFVDNDMNRFLGHPEDPTSYEARVGEELCFLLGQCDALLDLHSYSTGGPSFVYIGKPDGEEHDFAEALGAEAIVTGWQNAYQNSGVERIVKPYQSMGTTEYTRSVNPQALAVTCECGGHNKPDSITFARQAILNALYFFNLSSIPSLDTSVKAIPFVELYTVVWREGAGGRFTKDWQHLDQVKKGEIIAWQENKREVTARDDGYIVMPDPRTPQGKEWLYLGTGRNRHQLD